MVEAGAGVGAGARAGEGANEGAGADAEIIRRSRGATITDTPEPFVPAAAWAALWSPLPPPTVAIVFDNAKQPAQMFRATSN